MTQYEYRPCDELAGNIKCFWASEETPDEFNLFPVIPDSYIELVFNCGAPVMLSGDNGVDEVAPRVYLVGLQQKPLYWYTRDTSQFISVRFYAWAARPLVETATPLPDRSIVPLTGIWEDLGQMVMQTYHRQGHAEAVACLEAFMLDLYRRMKYDLTPARKAGELLYSMRGQVSMMDLAERCYLSPSQFQRRMKQVFGLPAKTYARLIRYEMARNALLLNPKLPVANLVYDYGYTDQSHLIHEFKTFTDYTPGELAKTRPVVNYMNSKHRPDGDEGFLQYPAFNPA